MVMTEKDILGFMELSIKVMKDSIQEKREDGKVSPLVGVVLVRPDGRITTAYRGELRDAEHAEFTLLERKCVNENLRGSVVFSTLEPCFERKEPKIACCRRLAKARVGKVYVGTTDPDPTVNGKGIKYLQDHGVEVEMYPHEFQKEIELLNAEFIKGALKRRKEAERKEEDDYQAEYEKPVPTARMEGLDPDLVNTFVARMDAKPEERNELLAQMELAANDGRVIKPTGLGLLLFGNRPQSVYPNAVVKATWKKDGKEIKVDTIEGPILKQTKMLFEWYKEVLPSHIDRSEVERGVVYDYPLEVVRELSINAIVHRDYELRGAPVYFEVNDDAIVIMSPGLPESPLTRQQISSFTAPSYSRNPVIMYVLDKFDQVEQRGLGFETVRRLPLKGIPLPIVKFNDPYIEFTLPLNAAASGRVDEKLAGLNEQELLAYDFVRAAGGKITKAEYAKSFNLIDRTAERHLKKLVDCGLLVSEGESRATIYKLAE